MKDQDWRRELQSYGVVQELHPRYADMDTERHVNNVSLQALYAEAHMRFLLHVMGPSVLHPGEISLHPAQVNTDYLRIAHYPQALQCGLALTGIDDSGYTMALGLFQAGECVGIQQVHCVAWRGAQRVALPAAVREALQAHLDASRMTDPAPESPAPHSADAYSHTSELTSRYGDLDAESCLSLVAAARYLEQARSTLVRASQVQAGINLSTGPTGMVVASVNLQISSRRAPSGRVRLGAMLSRIGNSSFGLRSAAFDEQGCLAAADNVLVVIDRETSRPTAIPDGMREALASMMVSPVKGEER